MSRESFHLTSRKNRLRTLFDMSRLQGNNVMIRAQKNGHHVFAWLGESTRAAGLAWELGDGVPASNPQGSVSRAGPGNGPCLRLGRALDQGTRSVLARVR